MDEQTGKIRLRLFDGTRKPYFGEKKTLVRVRSRTSELVAKWIGSSTTTMMLPVREAPDNFYSVIVHADGFCDAALYPVEPQADRVLNADVMLVPNKSKFVFSSFSALKSDPLLHALISSGDTEHPGRRYRRAITQSSVNVAALLTIGTAVRDFRLSSGESPLNGYYWEVMWDLLSPDRFWAWVDRRLADEIAKLQKARAVAEEKNPGFWHPGIDGRIRPATRSWKQVRFDVSNVQFAFHENDRQTRTDANGEPVDCVVLESDMDLYRDLGAHGLLEVAPNFFTGNKTNPLDIYRLRWMATRQEGVQPDFEPPVTVA